MTVGTSMEHDANLQLRTTLSADLRHAMQSRDRGRMRAIRDVMAAIDNAEAVPQTPGPHDPSLGVGAAEVPRDSLDVMGLAAVLDREVAERTDAAAEYREVGRPELADDLEAEAAIIQGYHDLLGHGRPSPGA